ncbi:MAG: flagellar basal body FlgE domain-containing protein [Ignavibacteriales bacterium]
MLKEKTPLPLNYNSSTAVTVYDSQGGAHDVTLCFVKTADNAWDVHYLTKDPANPNQLVDAGTQSLTFNTDGSLNNDNSGTPINFFLWVFYLFSQDL